jgi:hypothetical protein
MKGVLAVAFLAGMATAAHAERRMFSYDPISRMPSG